MMGTPLYSTKVIIPYYNMWHDLLNNHTWHLLGRVELQLIIVWLSDKSLGLSIMNFWSGVDYNELLQLVWVI